ncbi:unnamed protein product [Microthlaspi erraticum]|uniref:Uncharacterized protein n=1 Tax=Microthlaspi erraticum TaxID=1685480 RepID=A0A6D2IDR7_9BRAS|nr:unnamed protein product [Microthlaspi erraticum]
MAEDDDIYCQQELIGPLDPSLSMVFIRESPNSSKDDLVVFPPTSHENLLVASSVYGVDRYLESLSESESPSSSSRRSASSSSFSLSPSDSDGQSPLTSGEFDRKPPPESEEKPPPSPSTDSDGQPLLTKCQFDRKSSPGSPTEQTGKSPPCISNGKSSSKSMYREIDIFHNWELLLVRVYSKLKSLVTWFSTTFRPFYPVLAIAIWWWMRVRSRRKRLNGETTDRLRDVIKEKDERIVQLLHQIAQMNELLIKHHKDIVSRR